MKKGWKVFWIICAALTVAGVTLCIVGVCLGATFGSFKEHYPVYAYNDWDDDFDYDDDWDRPLASESVKSTGNSFTGITELDVEGKAPVEMIVKEHDGDTLEVDFDGLKSNVNASCRQDGSELKVDIKRKGARINNGGTVTIYLPKDTTYHEASFSVGSGILQIDNIMAQDLDVEVGAGQGVINGAAVQKLDAKCGAGELLMRNIVTEETDLDCGIGRIECEVQGAEQDFNYSVKCGIGQVSIGDESYAGLGGKKTINNGGAYEMEVDCGIGEVIVSFTK